MSKLNQLINSILLETIETHPWYTHPGKHAAIGAGIGGVAGGLLGYAAGHGDPEIIQNSILRGAIFGGIARGIAATLNNASIKPSTRKLKKEK